MAIKRLTNFIVSDSVRRFVARYGIFIILLIALLLRTVKLQFSYYAVQGEVFRDLGVVRGFLVDGIWPLLGPPASLGGYYFGPVYYYLLAPFVWLFNFAPFSATVASVFFSVSGIYVLYRLVLLWFGRVPIALLAAGITTISLFDIQNAYYISNPNLLPFFILIFLWSCTHVVQGKGSWSMLLVLGLSTGVATQLHATALAILPLLLVLALLYFKIRLTLAQRVAFVAGILLPYIPYFIHEAQHGFINTRNIFVLGEGAFSMFAVIGNLGYIVQFWDSLFFYKNGFFNIATTHAQLYSVLFVLYSSAVIGVAMSLLRWYQNRNRQRNRGGVSEVGTFLVFAWLGLGTIVFVFFKREIQYFYFLVLWPLPSILFAWLISFLWTIKRAAALYILIVFVVAQAAQMVVFYKTITTQGLNYKDFYAALDAVRQDATDTFKVINSSLDINTYNYLIKRYGLNAEEATHNAKLIYVLYIDDETQPIVGRSLGIYISTLTSGRFRVDKYQVQ